MQAALLGTYSNGIVELDEPIAKRNGNRVVENSINRMCGIFAGKIPFSVSEDFAKNKQKEKELEI